MNLHHLPQSEQENLLLENAWLHYFNQRLFQTGLISAEEQRQIAGRIAARGARQMTPGKIRILAGAPVRWYTPGRSMDRKGRIQWIFMKSGSSSG